MSQERPSTSSSKVRFLNLNAKGVRPITRSVSMKHLTAFTTVSNEHETPWSTANADARPSVAAQTPEANTARPATDPARPATDLAVSNSFSQQPEVDTPPGGRMEEDTTLCDNTDNDAGGCCKTVQHRRRARHMHAEAQPPKDTSGIPYAPQQTTRKRSQNQNPPPLPLHEEKIILRHHGGHCLDSWTRPELANALWSAAGLSTEDRQNIIFRLRPQQNLAVISTPKSLVADALYKVRELRLGQRVYPITTYFAAPDNNSCKGIVPGLVPGTPSSTLVDELLTPGTQILQARMMGQTNVALVTFEGLKVPRYVRFYGAELRCYPHHPRQLVCKISHRLGHWADHCPTPHVLICATCGTENPAPSHQCTPHCRSCDGSHPTSDPNCPPRARQTPNKAWVRNVLKKEQRELQPPQHIYCFQRIWQRLDTHKSRLRGHCERVRSLARDPVANSRPVPSLGPDPAEHQCGRPRNTLLTKLHQPHNNPTRRPCLPTPLPRWPRPPRRRRESRRKNIHTGTSGGKSSGGSSTARYSTYFTFYSVPSHYLILCSRSPGKNSPVYAVTWRHAVSTWKNKWTRWWQTWVQVCRRPSVESNGRWKNFVSELQSK
ncbi:hypothetical protein MRX96_052220 [Rhipicephalus microplus]